MRFLISLLTAITMGLIVFATSVTLSEAYVKLIIKPAPGDVSGLIFLYLASIVTLVIIFILIIVFRVFYEKLNVPLILFSSFFSLWLFQLFMLSRPFYTIGYSYFLPLILFVLAYLFIKRKNDWLSINGFTIGTILGLLLSYGAVILWRKIDNTLTSFFWFDNIEKTLVLIVTFLGAWIGNNAEKKRKIN